MFKTNWRKLYLLQQSISRAMSAMGNQEVFNEILLGERKIVDLELIYSQQGPYVPSSKSKVVPDDKRTFLGDALARQGEATLTFSDQSTLRVDYRHLGRGKHRDCLKFWQGPNESESKAVVAKIVPSAPDSGSFQDFQFLTECERAGVQVANLPKALACFESDRTMYPIMGRPCRATVLFTTLSGQGITITDVTNGKLQTGYEKNKFWLQYCSWASNVLQESIQRLGGIYTDCHFSNIVLLKRPVRQANNFEFSLVDASGLLQFGLGKNGTQKARKALTYWLEHCAFDIDHQYKQRMLPLADEIRGGESLKPFSNTWAPRDILTTALQNFGNVAQQICNSNMPRMFKDLSGRGRKTGPHYPVPLALVWRMWLLCSIRQFLQILGMPGRNRLQMRLRKGSSVFRSKRAGGTRQDVMQDFLLDPSFVPIGDMSQGSVPTKSESAGFPVHSTETGFPVMVANKSPTRSAGFPVMEHSFVPIGGTTPMAALPRHCSGTGFPVMVADQSQGSVPTRSESAGFPVHSTETGFPVMVANKSPTRSAAFPVMEHSFVPIGGTTPMAALPRHCSGTGFPVMVADQSQGSVPTRSESAGFPVHSTETGFPVMVANKSPTRSAGFPVMEHSFVPIGGTTPMAALPRHCSGTGFPVMDEDKSQGSVPTRSAESSGLPLLGLNNNAPERSIDEESLDQGFHPWSLKSEVKTEQMPQLPGMECPAIDYDPDDEAEQEEDQDDDEAVLKKFQRYLQKIQQSIPDGDVEKTENEWFVRIDMQQPHGKKLRIAI